MLMLHAKFLATLSRQNKTANRRAVLFFFDDPFFFQLLEQDI